MAIGTRANKSPRPASDFEAQLDRQINFLRRSCADFDKGESDEAIRISLAIRVLVHDTHQSTSLLKHLGIKDKLSYVDTGVYRDVLDPATQAWLDQEGKGAKLVASNPADVGLVEIGDAGNGRIGWFAPLRLGRFLPGTPPDKAIRKFAKFSSWWNDPLVESSSRKCFSRSHLVLIMANQDGGGHVDAELDADYKDLIIDPLMQGAHGSSLEGKTLDDVPPDALNNIAFASVRQIAFELMCTIDRYRHVEANPGILLMPDPYKDLPMPKLPHQPMNWPSPVISMIPG
ncbi:hypothetical protein [Methylobacterium sp. GC_Met_2]|uniref:hypothetical protein n=1 Tax=Methylobacterium sp. GC_Met_2 TaxID=2937376 RepID=UPI00226B5AC7|nr:hypothetical protein [Methylobacterium sp. GC_Met_2]